LARPLQLLCTVLMLAVLSPVAAADTYPDTEVKAAFVLRFAGYVEWPPHGAAGREFIIAVYGDDALAGALQRLAAGRPLHGRAVLVRRIDSLAEASGAQIVYVDSRHQRRLRAARATMAGKGALIVSDGEQGLAAGSMISFRLAGNRVRFEVALGTARAAGLRISPDLLALAVRVTE
jgi:hypothetical protein